MIFYYTCMKTMRITMLYQYKETHHHTRGFSLTELSIALVIIALLLAAVSQGENILRAAKLKSITSEMSEKQAWINGFRTIYSQLPGDFSYAVDYWGAASGTLSGNDNGAIAFLESGVYEGYRAWEHLSHAQIADTNFRGGPASPATTAAIVNEDIPNSVISNAGYLLGHALYNFTATNVLVLGRPAVPSGSTLNVNGALSAQEAFNLDTKIDDGSPITGSLQAANGVSSLANSCVDTTSSPNRFNVQQTGIDCTLGFRLATE
jgi:prepilin-type N-terminal cleavage/methylation domain-containing protein